MPLAISVLIPIVLCVGIGFVAKRQFGVGNEVWAGIEKLTYYLFAPSLLISSLANKSLDQVPWEGMFITLVSVLLLSAVVLIAIQLSTHRFSGPQFTSVFQGGVSFNSFVVLALAELLFGADGLGVGALASVIVVITVNILCVTVFSLAGSQSGGLRKLPKQLLTNPLIIGCVVGLVLNLSGVGLVGPINDLAFMLGKVALPMALLCVGAALQVTSARGNQLMIILTSVMQFLFKPLLGYLLARYLGVEGISLVIVVICLASPTAPSAYVLARQLGGDAQAMAAVITVQTVLAFVTLPVTLALLGV